jgi:hypothetical protein
VLREEIAEKERLRLDLEEQNRLKKVRIDQQRRAKEVEKERLRVERQRSTNVAEVD